MYKRQVMAIPGTTGGLAVDGDYPHHNANEAADPFTETGLEYLGIQQAEYPAKSVMGRCAVLKNQVLLQPSLVVLGPFGCLLYTSRCV